MSFTQWKMSKVRALGRGESYLRLTPHFGFKFPVGKRSVAYSTVGGWSLVGFKRRKVKRQDNGTIC